MRPGLISLKTSLADGVYIRRHRKSPLFGEKIQEPCLVVHAVTSMDDAIDLASR